MTAQIAPIGGGVALKGIVTCHIGLPFDCGAPQCYLVSGKTAASRAQWTESDLLDHLQYSHSNDEFLPSTTTHHDIKSFCEETKSLVPGIGAALVDENSRHVLI
jgi:hypothetical protein